MYLNVDKLIYLYICVYMYYFIPFMYSNEETDMCISVWISCMYMFTMYTNMHMHIHLCTHIRVHVYIIDRKP